jgi:hypothetical protein
MFRLKQGSKYFVLVGISRSQGTVLIAFELGAHIPEYSQIITNSTWETSIITDIVVFKV